MDIIGGRKVLDVNNQLFQRRIPSDQMGDNGFGRPFAANTLLEALRWSKLIGNRDKFRVYGVEFVRQLTDLGIH